MNMPGLSMPGLSMPGAATQGADFGKQLLGQFENYLGVTRSLWELLGKSASVTDPMQRQQVFNEGLAALQTQFAGMFAPFGNLLTPAATSAWQPGAMSFNPAEWSQWPALGPAREHQQSWQKMAAIVTRCAQAQGKLATVWNEIIAAGLKELGSKLSPRIQSGGLPGSMKELYDTWVESAESAYSRAAHGAAFMQAQAELSNAMSELRIAQREVIEEWGKQFDLPTRAEINGLHQQLKQLSDALRKLGG
jgi:class III poly(R)-hydroxyalkanoic acid synthase PhaE subunit